MVTLLWFGRDLRLADNPALQAALARGGTIVPVFILDDEDAGSWAPGGAARWWLHGSIEALARDLLARGAPLVLRRGRAQPLIDELVARTGADAVYWNRRYEPWATARNERIKQDLKARGIEARSFNAALLSEPWSLSTQKGEPYRVFTPFWKALQIAGALPPGADAPARIPAAAAPPGDALASWSLRPHAPDWAGGLRERWTPGEAAARARLDRFVEQAVRAYAQRRNLPGESGTSGLSPHLHFGEIGPRGIWAAVKSGVEAATGRAPSAAKDDGAQTFLSEIAWREFSYHLLFHFPTLPEQPLRSEFAAFPWTRDVAALARWQRGTTGFPIVDAGMRELWTTGWMHNRVRMIVASFLVKDLLLDWRLGQAWFWDTLVDADLASNSASWQWVAGCGADAAPYFRVFNPVLQAARFDPDGSYVRRWVPELARLPDALLHAPWEARPSDLAAAGIELGRTYPAPMLDHGQARDRALAAFAQIKKGGGATDG
jgi:deoxyribodipyrimidine photo-lyase